MTAAWRRLCGECRHYTCHVPVPRDPYDCAVYVSDLFHRIALSSLSSQIRVANKLN